MATQRRRPSTHVTLTSIAVLALVLAACAQSAGGGFVPREGDETVDRGAPGAEGGAPVPGASAGAGGDTGSGGDFAPIEQRIVKTGEVTIEVGSVADALAEVRALVGGLGGYVGGSQAGTLDERATLTLRIPAARFDEALAQLHELDGTLIAESTRETDVTGQVVDLEARIGNLRASEAAYRELAARAERVEDVLAVQARLDQVRGEIEQLTAQLDQLTDQADLSTLVVTLVPAPTPVETQSSGWDPGGQVDRALAALVGIGQGLVDGLIWFAILWLPLLLVLAFGVIVALRGLIEVRRRMAVAAPTAPVASGDDAAA